MLGKRIWMILLAAALCLQLTGCRSDSLLLSALEKTVGICVREESANQDYYASLAEAVKAMGYTVVLEDAQNDQSRQNGQVSRLIEEKCDLLVIEPVMVSALEDILSQVKNARLPVVLLDRQPEEQVLNSYEGFYFVGCDIAQAGIAQAALLEGLNLQGDINGDGEVCYMMLRGPEDHLDAQLITDSCNLALSEQNTRLLCTVQAQWEAADSRAQCSQYLARFGRDIEVIFCNDARLAQGAVEAVQNGGWTPGQDVYILSVGINGQLQTLIGQGAVAATVIPDPQKRIAVLSETVEQLLSGQTPEKLQYIPYIATP